MYTCCLSAILRRVYCVWSFHSFWCIAGAIRKSVEVLLFSLFALYYGLMVDCFLSFFFVVKGTTQSRFWFEYVIILNLSIFYISILKLYSSLLFIIMGEQEYASCSSTKVEQKVSCLLLWDPKRVVDSSPGASPISVIYVNAIVTIFRTFTINLLTLRKSAYIPRTVNNAVC